MPRHTNPKTTKVLSSHVTTTRSSNWGRTILAFVLGGAMTFLIVPARSGSKSGQAVLASGSTSTAEQSLLPRTLGELFARPESQLAQLDIALVNLLCAEGLPGSEGLDIAGNLRQLNEWAERVRSETDRNLHQFNDNPDQFENSEMYFRMLTLTTVLQQDFGVHYNPERVRDPDFRDSRDLFIHGLLANLHAGTCLNLPVLTVAIGRRLGYPLTLAQTKQHLFVRWELSEGHLNFETTSQGLVMHPDSFYATWPEELSAPDLVSGAYLRAMSCSEEVAVFLQARGHCQEDTGLLADAQISYALAHRLAPALPHALAFLAASVDREMRHETLLTTLGSPVRSKPRTSEEMAALAARINALNGRPQQLMGSPLPTPIPSVSIPFGGLP